MTLRGFPDLQRLVDRYGGFDKIPSEAWAQFDQQAAEWRAQQRANLLAAKQGRRG